MGSSEIEHPTHELDTSERAYAHFAAGRRGHALALIREAITQDPGNADLAFTLGSLLFDWGRYREARLAFLGSLQGGVERAALYLNLAWCCHLLNRSEEAEAFAHRAIAVDPAEVAGYLGRGSALQRLRRFPEAIATFERALELQPHNAECYESIALCQIEQAELVDAERWARRAVAASDTHPRAWITLGMALAKQQRMQEALAALGRAVALERAIDGPMNSIVDYGVVLLQTGQYEEAVAFYRAELPRTPHPGAQKNYAFALLSLGEFIEGWRQYEFRWMEEPYLSNRLDPSRPPWSGQDLVGKSILMRAEQGFGDIFQFARYAALLKARGATVILQSRPEIATLARGFRGVDQVFVAPGPAPAYDYYVHLLSIPHAMRTELATVPSDVPYLLVDEARQREWASRFAGNAFRVGVVWAGNPQHTNDRYRSMPSAALTPLFGVGGAHFYFLQKGATDAPIDPYDLAPNRTDLGPQLRDFEDTAAAIMSLDLVICVDTSVAHLAGALGRPVWVLLPAVGDFRWMKDSDRSAWYPTMRLFWQRNLGDWTDVVAHVTEQLLAVVQTGVGAMPDAGPPKSLPHHDPEIEGRPDIAEVLETYYGIVQYFPDESELARCLREYGEYRQREVELLLPWLKPGSTVLAIGAGIGVHALALARAVNDQGHLIVYEWRQPFRQVLEQNLAANRVKQFVTVMRGRLVGRVGVETDPKEYECDTLDDLCLERLDLLHVDGGVATSGFLDGAEETLWRLRPRVIIQLPGEAAFDDFAQRLLALGYRCWRMEVPLFAPRNFYRRTDDIFAGRRSLTLIALPEEANDVPFTADCVEIAGDDPRDAAAEIGATRMKKPTGLLRSLRGLLFGNSKTSRRRDS